MVPVVSAVEGAHGSECVLLLRARMAVAALAMRRRALLGRVRRRRMRSWPCLADLVRNGRAGLARAMRSCRTERAGRAVRGRTLREGGG